MDASPTSRPSALNAFLMREIRSTCSKPLSVSRQSVCACD
jgi:hypothetical protein